jgi:hypothetical protein
MPSDDFLCCPTGQWVLVEDLGSATSKVWGGTFDFSLGKCTVCSKNWMSVLPPSGWYPPSYATISDEEVARIRALKSYEEARREKLLLEWFDKD